jgi:hypothetical protein
VTPEIKTYRPRNRRIAVAYSTKDRVEFTRATIGHFLDSDVFDLFWFDGSATTEGRSLALDLCSGSSAICELHQNVVGGPDSAIMYALRTLQPHAYDLTILIENDVLVTDGWLDAIRASMTSASAAGFRVGAGCGRLYAQRVLSFNGDYCLLVNSGAGCIALTPPAVAIVLDNYRTVDALEFLQRFEAVTGIDLQSTVEFAAGQMLSCDFFFDLLLYLHGYVVTAPPVTFVSTIDGSDTTAGSNRHLVRHIDDHLPVTHHRLKDPGKIKDIPYPFFRFPRSRQSDRAVIGCHQLLLDVNKGNGTAPVQARGEWRRRWLQSIGPFSISGSGHLTIALYKSVVGLVLVTGNAAAEIHITTSSGQRVAYNLTTNILADVAVNANDVQASYVEIDLSGGDVAVVGLTVETETIAYYANRRPTIEHLPQ